jgi:hypothetical protein
MAIAVVCICIGGVANGGVAFAASSGSSAGMELVSMGSLAPVTPTHRLLVRSLLQPGKKSHTQAKRAHRPPDFSAEKAKVRFRPAAASLLQIAGSSGAAASNPAPATEAMPGTSPMSGLGFTGLSEQSVPPPDVQIAAGSSQLAEMVNLELGVWSKAGSQVGLPVPLASLFGTGSDHIGDPRLLFDATTGRWFSSLVDVTNGSVYLGVSGSSDITGAWWFYRFSISGCPDQPRLGINGSQVLISVNLLTVCSEDGNQGGVRVLVIAKSGLTAEQAANVQLFTSPGLFAIAPAQTLGSGSTGWMASVDPHYSSTLHVFQVTGVPPQATVTQQDVPLSPAVQDPPDASQLSGPQIDTGDDRLQDAAWQNGQLLVSFNDACSSLQQQLGSCAAAAAVSTNGTPSLLWRRDFAAQSGYAYYPAVRPDPDGNVLICFGTSSASQYPSGVVAAVNNQGTPSATYALVQSGSYPIQNDRYGDYFGAAVDPAHPHTIWAAAEVGNNPTGVWGTAIRAVTSSPEPARLGNASLVARATANAASLRAVVEPAGTAAVYKFQYGTTKGYGSQSGAGATPGGTGPVTVTTKLRNLRPGTTYHVRTVVSDPAGTTYGQDHTFRTRPVGKRRRR